MKLSITLPDSDVEIIDADAREAGLESRSAAIAWQEWDASGEADLWDRVSGDGLSDASR